MSVEPSPFSIVGFIKLIRLPNLLMIAFNQYIVAFFLIPAIDPNSLLVDVYFHILVISTLIVASAGYLINDYYDVKIDLINKPDKVIIGQDLKRRPIMILHLMLNFAGFVMGLLVSWKIGFVNALSSVTLWFYSNQMKRWPFVGNLVVSLLTAMSLWVVGIYFNSYTKLLLVYCFFAFMMTLIREIVKDIEDQKGDQVFGCYTLPIAIGLRKTKMVLYLLVMIFCLGLIAFLSKINNDLLLIYFICLSIPFAFFLFKLVVADAKKHFSRLSLLIKLIMLSGIVSMVFV